MKIGDKVFVKCEIVSHEFENSEGEIISIQKIDNGCKQIWVKFDKFELPYEKNNLILVETYSLQEEEYL